MSRPIKPKTASEAFDDAAPGYDAWVRQALPTYEELFGVATELVPHDRDAAISVADLGAGSGLFSERLSRAFPNARFDLFDASTEMLTQARRRFATQPDRFALRLLRLEEFSEVNKYDAVVSSLAIHHLEHDQKRSLYERVFASLRPDGAFVNVDQVRGEPPFGDLYWNTWLNKVRAAGASESQIQASIARRLEFDRDADLSDQLEWLRQSGFQADCIYKHYFIAVFLALKPAADLT